MEIYNPEIKCKKCGHDKHSVHYKKRRHSMINNAFLIVEDEWLEVACLKCGYVDEYKTIAKKQS